MDYKQEIKEIIRMADNEAPEFWRKGQAIYNFSYKKFPEAVDSLEYENFLKDVDCFYKDENIPAFLTALQTELEKRY